MLVAALACLTLISPAYEISRDAFGVPLVRARTVAEAFEGAGYAVAQDRLWQMELSRRASRGRLAELLGPSAFNADRDRVALGYTDAELQTQIERLSPEARTALESYARGVNAWIAEAKQAGKLPEGYRQAGVDPEPWSPVDSAAIMVTLFQTFGQGGAGEVRNLALLKYLQARPNKAEALDIFEDFLWFNDPNSPTTLEPGDDPLRGKTPSFASPSRKVTEGHLAALPNVSLGELLPAIRIAEREEPSRIAAMVSAPYKAGSYAVVVGPKRSATGQPMLLSAPQMGHESPSIVHEISIASPGYTAVGMDVPGVPGVAIGYGPEIAWGLTSGVADTTDIFILAGAGEGKYRFGSQEREIVRVERNIAVRGEAPRNVTVQRTHLGPVLVTSRSTGAIFAQRSGWWMRELESFEACLRLPMARNVGDVDAALRHATVSFNCFFALRSGDIGWRYLGAIPQRSTGVDPRLPVPATPENDWRGFIPYESMPRVDNPRRGLITNWNNKPAQWWPNFDTPAWGRLFRVSTLRGAIPDGALRGHDLELAAWRIARRDDTLTPFTKLATPILLKAYPEGSSDALAPWARQLMAFDGTMLDGSRSARIAVAFIDALREQLFLAKTGNFLSPATFRTVGQTSVMLQAIEGKTKLDYLAGRTREALVLEAFRIAATRLSEGDAKGEDVGYRPGVIAIAGESPIPYRDRGTFIQVVDFTSGRPQGRSVLSPGIAESGPHSRDQIPLARHWTYKPMRLGAPQ